LGGNSIGSFDPCDYSIKFRSATDINSYNVTAELFHAYQEQFLRGKLTQIVNSSDKKGGSNMEIEEKAMLMLTGIFVGGMYPIYPEQVKLYTWLLSFIGNRDFSSEIVLTEEEKQSWFKALEEFQQYHYQLYLNDPDPNKKQDFYSRPIDYDMLPDTLLFLLRNSGCVAP